MNDLFFTIIISLEVSLTSTIICAIIGIPIGLLIAVNEFKFKEYLITILNAMLAIPTVVVGIFIYALISRNGIFGNFHMLFTPKAIIIGQVILALPIMITFSQSAISALNKTALETAFTLGANNFEINKVLIKEARFGIVASIAAVFGRLIGEVGVAMMLGGNIKGFTRTMTTAIALESSKGEFAFAFKLGCILLVIALFVNFIFKFFQSRAER